MQQIILKIRHFEEDYQTAFKKLAVFVVSNPVLFNGQNHQKQTGPGTSDWSLFR